ncbi:MAG TPA: homoserine dehydrogenase [Clostridiales bacterium]|nr:homoserine dehydrogenase [Clostridiales bacterium]
MVKIAIMGYGTVGSGVYDIIKANNFAYEAMNPIEIKYILDIRDFPEHREKEIFTKDFNDILNDDEIYCVVEAMGGLKPAYEFTKSLLLAGKNVVTSNKELVATHGPELLKIAREKNVNYLFEASVGGGIPIIKPLCSSLKANKIKKIAGILNGTTNFILTEMVEEGKSFAEALKMAQDNGYAERNPAADIEGHDACRKIAILASLAWGEYIDYKDIPTEGITNVTLEDVEAASRLGYSIKLIGYADKRDGLFIWVSPMLVRKSCPLSSANGVFNAILVDGNYLGTSMFYGQGAGKFATASAMVADVIESVRHINAKKAYIEWNVPEKSSVIPVSESENRYFVRTKAEQEKIEKIFGKIAVSDINGERVFVTDVIKEKDFEAKAKSLGVISKIRVLDA